MSVNAALPLTDASGINKCHLTMDDFDYSVHISELDWISFFHECEECDLLSPAMASSDGSGASDADDVDTCPSDGNTGADCSIDGPPDSEGLLVERYTNMGDPRGPEDLLSSSEEDMPFEAVNRFFERLKNLADAEGSLMCGSAVEATGSGHKVIGLHEQRVHVAPKEILKSQECINQNTGSNKFFAEDSSSADVRVVCFNISNNDVEADTGSFTSSLELSLVGEPDEEGSLKTEDKPSVSNTSSECDNKPAEEQFCHSKSKLPSIIEGGQEINPLFMKGSFDSLLDLQKDPPTSPTEQDGIDILVSPEYLSVISPTSKEDHWFIAKEASSLKPGSLLCENKNMETAHKTISKYVDCNVYIDPTDCRDISPDIIPSREHVISFMHENNSAFDDRTLTEDRSVLYSNIHPVFQQQDIEDSEEVTNGPNLHRHSWEECRINNETKGHDDNDAFHWEKLHIHTKKQCNVTEAREATKPEEFHPLKQSKGSENVEKTHNFQVLAKDVEHHQYDKGSLNRLVNLTLEKSDSTEEPASELCSFEDNKETIELSSPASSVNAGWKDIPLPAAGEFFFAQCVQKNVQHVDSVSGLHLEQFISATSLEESTTAIPISASQQLLSSKVADKMNEPTQQENIDIDQKKTDNVENLHAYSQKISTSTEKTTGADRPAPEQESPVCKGDVKAINLNTTTHHAYDMQDLQIGNCISRTGSIFHVSENSNASIICNNILIRPVGQGSCSSPQTEYKKSTIGQPDAETTIPIKNYKTDLSTSPCETLDDKRLDMKGVCALPNPDSRKTIQRHRHEAIAATDHSELSNEISKHSQICASGSDLLPSSSKTSGYPIKMSDMKSVPHIPPDRDTSKCIQTHTDDCMAICDDRPEISTDSDNNNLSHTHEGTAFTDNSALSINSSPEEQTSEAGPGPEPDIHEQVEPTHPVYAISCFWDEMEKLTINDILHLKLVSNAKHSIITSDQQGSTMMNVSNVVDSNILTQPEDSEPDCSSGNISSIFNMEEELLLIHNARGFSSAEQRVFVDQDQNSQGTFWESGEGSSSMRSYPGLKEELWTQSSGYEHLILNNTQQCLRKICKNISVQNLQALEAEPGVGHGRRAASMHDAVLKDAVLTPSVSSIPTPMESHNNSEYLPQSSFSRGYFPDNAISFPEIFEHFFSEDETETGLSDTTESSTLLNDGKSVPETYDYFFSDFETSNLFLPLLRRDRNGQNEPVSIFSQSRSTKQRLQFSPEYDFFFPDDSPVVSEDDDDDDAIEQALVRVVTHSNSRRCKTVDMTTSVDMYDEFFDDKNWTEDLFWRNPLSLRGVCLPSLTGTKLTSSSWSLRSIDCGEKPLPRTPKLQAHPQTPAHIYQLETWVFRQMMELQERHTNLLTALIDPRRDSPLLTLRQSDLCLICIAFASWVLRSASPQALDTWKAALLANISALSAIRYLRWCRKGEVAQEKP